MSFLARIGRLFKGFFSLFVDDMERRNPKLVLQELQDRLREAQMRFNTTTAQILAREKVAKKKLVDEQAKLEEVRRLIQAAKRQNDRELALQLLIQEENQLAATEASEKTYNAIRAEAEAARKEFEAFQADVYQQMQRIESLKNQADLKVLKEQMNELRSQYQTEAGAGAIKADLGRVEQQITEGLAEAEAVAELGANNIDTRMRQLKADAARSRAEDRLKQLFGEEEAAPATEEGAGRAVREKAKE